MPDLFNHIACSFGSNRASNKEILIDRGVSSVKAEMLIERIGITDRFLSLENENSLTLASKAFNALIDSKGSYPDCLITVTQTSPYYLPHISAFLLAESQENNIFSLDINLGCSGFVYAFIVLNSLKNSSMITDGVIVCADTYSKFINDESNSTYLIFSDAASAININFHNDFSMLSCNYGTAGNGTDKLILENYNNPELYMDGAAVLKFSTREVLSSIEQAIQDSALTKKDIDLFLFHQASNLVLDTLQKKLDISDSQLPRNLKEIGNTTSSSIPILINELLQRGQLQKGQTILMSGFGVGLSWATCVIKI